MIKKLFLTFIISFCLITTGCGNKRKDLCTDKPVMELAIAKFAKHNEIHTLLKELKKNGYVSQAYSDTTRSNFVQIQYLFESAFASMIKYNQALKVVGVIYTPTPSTPLRTDGSNLNLLLGTDQINKPEIVDTVVSRYESLHQFLRSGSTLYNIHENSNTSVPGMSIYNANLRIYSKNLKDISVNKINNDFIGASYLLECHNGEKILFSISSHQVSENNPRAEWELFYGNIDANDKLYNQFIILQNIYKEHGVDFSAN